MYNFASKYVVYTYAITMAVTSLTSLWRAWEVLHLLNFNVGIMVGEEINRFKTVN